MGNKQKVIAWTLVIVWMIVIFMFSSQSGSDSSQTSNVVLNAIERMLAVVGLESYLEFSALVVRKVAHMIEYAILASLVYHALSYQVSFRKHLFLASFAFATSYAITDEIHQLFVPGRAGSIKDVGFDSIGAGLALLIIYVVDLAKTNSLDNGTGC